MRSAGTRLIAAVFAVVWMTGGGYQVAHADVGGMDPSHHMMNPVAWMRGAADPATPADPDVTPAMPFHCQDDDATGTAITVGGIGAPGLFGAGPGLASLVVAQDQTDPASAKPSPGATPSIDMSRPGTAELVFPQVPEEDVRAVTDNIICQCGCGLSVAACELAMPCDVSKQMKYQAAKYLAEGKTPAETLTQFEKDWGERVLAAPTKEGFNLTAWVLPFVGLGLGLVLVVWALLTWRKQQPATEQAPPTTDPEMLSRIEDDVKRGM